MQAQLFLLSCPAIVAPGKPFSATFQLENTGTVPLPAGGVNAVHIGSQNPVDNATWGTARVYLPQDVPVGGSVQVVATLIAPTVPGSYTFAWQPVQEGIAWFGNTVAQAVAVPYLNPMLANPGDGSIIGTNILQTGPYLCNVGTQSIVWTFAGPGRFGILLASVWAGLDPGAVADMSFGVSHPIKGLIGWLPFDRYAPPSLPDVLTYPFPDPGIILNPGDQLTATMFNNSNPAGVHAANALSLWGRYL